MSIVINGNHNRLSLKILSLVSCRKRARNIASTGNKKNTEPHKAHITILHKPEKPNTENLDRALKEMLGKANKIAIEKRKAIQPSSIETIVVTDHLVCK
jgi:hypothetical protein